MASGDVVVATGWRVMGRVVGRLRKPIVFAEELSNGYGNLSREIEVFTRAMVAQARAFVKSVNKQLRIC
jgi:hypothetical protein